MPRTRRLPGWGFAHRCAPACSSCTARRGETRARSILRSPARERRDFPPTSGSFPPAAARGSSGKIRAGRMSRILPRACRFRKGARAKLRSRSASPETRTPPRAARGRCSGRAPALPWQTPPPRSGAWRAARAPRPWNISARSPFHSSAPRGAPCRAGRGKLSGGSAFPAISPSWCSTAGKTVRKPRSGSSGGTRCSARAAWSTISCFSPRPPGITGTSSARRSKRRLRQCAFPKRSLCRAGCTSPFAVSARRFLLPQLFSATRRGRPSRRGGHARSAFPRRR